MITRTNRCAAVTFVLLSGFVVVACDEDRATPVAGTPASTAPNPNGPPTVTGNADKNPISGNRKSALGKAYDVAEDLRDNKIPAYNKKIEEEIEKGKPGAKPN